MSLNIGGINIQDSIVNLEFRVGVMERIMDHLARRGVLALSQSELEQMRSDVIKELQKKFPEAGIYKKS